MSKANPSRCSPVAVFTPGDDGERRSAAPDETRVHVCMCAVGGIYGDCKPTDACRCCNSARACARSLARTRPHNSPLPSFTAMRQQQLPHKHRETKERAGRKGIRSDRRAGRKTQIIEANAGVESAIMGFLLPPFIDSFDAFFNTRPVNSAGGLTNAFFKHSKVNSHFVCIFVPGV